MIWFSRLLRSLQIYWDWGASIRGRMVLSISTVIERCAQSFTLWRFMGIVELLPWFWSIRENELICEGGLVNITIDGISQDPIPSLPLAGPLRWSLLDHFMIWMRHSDSPCYLKISVNHRITEYWRIMFWSMDTHCCWVRYSRVRVSATGDDIFINSSLCKWTWCRTTVYNIDRSSIERTLEVNCQLLWQG